MKTISLTDNELSILLAGVGILLNVMSQNVSPGQPTPEPMRNVETLQAKLMAAINDGGAAGPPAYSSGGAAGPPGSPGYAGPPAYSSGGAAGLPGHSGGGASSAMGERVVQAMSKSSCIRVDGAWDLQVLARAAIAAMRDPTKEMLITGLKSVARNDDIGYLWQAMIDTALNEGQPEIKANEQEQ